MIIHKLDIHLIFIIMLENLWGYLMDDFRKHIHFSTTIARNNPVGYGVLLWMIIQNTCDSAQKAPFLIIMLENLWSSLMDDITEHL